LLPQIPHGAFSEESRAMGPEKLWLGHATKDMTDKYAEQLKEDVGFRKQWAEKIGLGFDLPTEKPVGQLGQPEASQEQQAEAA
jgi:hypothetical protein